MASWGPHEGKSGQHCFSGSDLLANNPTLFLGFLLHHQSEGKDILSLPMHYQDVLFD